MIVTPVPQFLFCGLTQKEKEGRMESFSFSYLLLSLLNNLLWLAYSQKIGDENIGFTAIVGKCIHSGPFPCLTACAWATS